jgi:hypothetical protein
MLHKANYKETPLDFFNYYFLKSSSNRHNFWEQNSVFAILMVKIQNIPGKYFFE